MKIYSVELEDYNKCGLVYYPTSKYFLDKTKACRSAAAYNSWHTRYDMGKTGKWHPHAKVATINAIK